MASFPTSPVYGQTALIGAITFYYNGSGWVPQNSEQVNFTFSLTPPAFANISKGHIWVKSDTLDQYIYVIDDNNGTAWVTLGSTATNPFFVPQGQQVNNRNIILNGHGAVDQRNNGSAIAGVTSGYVVDRWKINTPDTNCLTGGRNFGGLTTYPTGFKTYIGVKNLAVGTIGINDIYDLRYTTEGYDVESFNYGSVSGRNVTLSFYVYGSIAGTYALALRNAANTRSYVTTYTINSTNTWEYKSITITPEASGTWLSNSNASLQLSFVFGSGANYLQANTNSWQIGNTLNTAGTVNLINTANSYIYLTGIQLELGDTPTSYEKLPYQEILQKCKRYFYQYGPDQSVGLGFEDVGNTAVVRVQHPVEMRGIPNISYSNVNVTDYSNTVAVSTVNVVSSASTNETAIKYNVASGITTHRSVVFLTSPTGFYKVDADF